MEPPLFEYIFKTLPVIVRESKALKLLTVSQPFSKANLLTLKKLIGGR